MSLSAVRLIVYSPWAGDLEPAADHLARLPTENFSHRLPRGADEELRRMARLDRDWHGECVRCLAQTPPPAGLVARPALTLGVKGLAALAARAPARPADEAWWLVFIGQQPENIGAPLPALCTHLRRHGVRLAYYAYDEASRGMPCFATLAPHLDLLIHDEFPLGPAASGLRADCVVRHRSWVANLRPHEVPFNEAPEPRVLFLGSRMGLTAHRRRQIEFLHATFGDRFVASHDHSVSVAERGALSRYAVGFCPEGRKFATPGMARSHTDRPFWCGCMGLVPVAEDSAAGGRLEDLAAAGLVVRYPHGDLAALRRACEDALALGREQRRRIYDHFNRHETVGTVLAEALAEAHAPACV
jgi:hypothetical protein